MLPALASDTALDMALEEMALFLFMISSNSASLRGVRDASMSLHLHKDTRDKGHTFLQPMQTIFNKYKCIY